MEAAIAAAKRKAAEIAQKISEKAPSAAADDEANKRARLAAGPRTENITVPEDVTGVDWVGESSQPAGRSCPAQPPRQQRLPYRAALCRTGERVMGGHARAPCRGAGVGLRSEGGCSYASGDERPSGARGLPARKRSLREGQP